MQYARKMVHTILIAALCMLAIPISAVGAGASTGDGTWTWASPTPVGASLRNVTFASSTVGWAVGYGGNIVTTADGGTTWTGQDSDTYAPLMAIDAVNTDDVWTVGRGGTIRYSVDGGSSWTAQTSGTTEELRGVDFLNTSNGWACGGSWSGPSVILHTNNGGGNWASQTTTSTGYIYDIAFADANNGMAVGQAGTLLQTTDGGTTWTPYSGTKPWTTGGLNRIQALSASTWVMVGPSTYLSTDSGATWSTIGSGAIDLYFLDENTGWIMSNTWIRSTTDGGDNWSYQSLSDVGTGDSWQAVHFTDANNGVLVGSHGNLAASTDGGDTWVTVTEYPLEGSAELLTDITTMDFIDSSHAIAAGYDKRYWLTDDGGQYWTAKEFPAGGGTDAVEFPSTSIGYALSQDSGSELSVMKSTDGGESFAALSHPLDTDHYARDLTAPSTSTVWAVGAREDANHDQFGWVMRSSDGGSSFATQTIRAGGDPEGEISTIFALDSSNAWIAGELEDTMYHTTDGGSSWTTQTVPVSGVINDIFFLDTNNGWACGAGSSNTLVLKTIDGGTNWTEVDLSGLDPDDLNLTSITFSDSLNGVAVGYHNPFSSIPASAIVTDDGGATWTVENTGCDSQTHQVVWDGTRYWMGGDNNRLLYRGPAIADTFPPVTSASGVPSGWSSEDATITLTAIDHGSGVAATAYKINGGPGMVYSGPIGVTAEGTNTIAFASTDASGNAEATKTVDVLIDKSPPVTTAEVTGNNTTSAQVTLTPVDALAGVTSTTYRVDSGPWTGGTSVTLDTAGDYRVEFYSEDNAQPANVETTKYVDVTVASDTVAADRISGTDRYETTVKASQANFASATTVVLATGANFADALAASGLAGSYDGPLLLTSTNSLPGATANEIARLGATQVILVGGPSAISGDVEDAVDDLSGVSVSRIEGATRYHTAAKVAEAIAANEGGSFAGRAFIARGDSFADALAAAPLAYSQAQPILLVQPTALPSITKTTLEGLGITDCTVAGGTGAVSDDVVDDIDAISGMNTPYRAAGADRYSTARAIADRGVSQGWADYAFVGVATGESFPDGLSGGACAGSNGGVLLLTATATLSTPAANAISANKGTIQEVEVYGGTKAVTTSVYSQIEALLE